MAANHFPVLLDSVNETGEESHDWLKLSAPAKVNLMLSVHGRRPDGFHELTSLVAALEFGDELEIRRNGREQDTLLSEGEDVPQDDTNLVLQAARLFRRECAHEQYFDFRLNKQIPVGAGLGGGSSDAVAALKGMNALLETGFSREKIREMASTLGSDCPFFVDATPSLMRGRGEVLEPIDPYLFNRLAGQRLVLFRPDFGINTAWAYGRLASMPELYEGHAIAETRLREFSRRGNWDDMLANVFEEIVGEKFLAIPSLLEILGKRGYKCMMSGSGSACFALVDGKEQALEIKEVCQECWGPNIFWVETSLTEQKM
ncbi:4-(cytidine 5'-diphospho)-2-C-methyl-D-erythritol kinase [Coraliomargarita sinensis]|nr:4-(cytidine 5'-diphospho)-2-C-methyl-D-erythritol kinase [Coraliomargarita sinensis]